MFGLVLVKGLVKLAEKRRFKEEGMLDESEAKVAEGLALEPPPAPEAEETDGGEVMWLRKGFGLMDDDAENVEIGDVGAPDEPGLEFAKPKEVDMDRWRGKVIESGAVEVLLLWLLLLWLLLV